MHNGTIDVVSDSKFDASKRVKIGPEWYGCWLSPFPQWAQRGTNVVFALDQKGKNIVDLQPANAGEANVQMQPPTAMSQAPQQAPPMQAQPQQRHGGKEEWIMATGIVGHYIEARGQNIAIEDLKSLVVEAVRCARTASLAMSVDNKGLRRMLNGQPPFEPPAAKPEPPPSGMGPHDPDDEIPF